MARQLRTQGQDVALLSLFDTAHPHHKMSISKRLYLHAYSLRRLGLLGYIWEKAWEGTKRRVLNVACKLLFRFGCSLPHALQYTYVLKRNTELSTYYEAPPYPGRVTLFWAADYWVSPDDYYLGWKRVATGGVEVYKVPGEHHTLLAEPHVRVLAARLKSCLDKAQTNSS